MTNRPKSQLGNSGNDDDRAFFRDAVEQALDRLYATALRLTRNQADAEDLVADTFARAWTNLNQLDNRQAVTGWLLRILVNIHVSNQRQVRSEARATEEAARAETFSLFERLHQPFLLWWSNPERELIDKLLREDIETALNKLPPEYRTVVALVEIDGNSYAEVATMLGVPIGTVRSRLSRARSQLQRNLWRQAQAKGLIGGKGELLEGNKTKKKAFRRKPLEAKT